MTTVFRALLTAFFLVAGAGASALAAPGGVASVAAERTAFKVTTSDGRVLRSPDLVGVQFVVAGSGKSMRLRIDGVERDPKARRGDVWLHSLSYQAGDGSWQNLCEAGPDGRRQAFPIAGRARPAASTIEAAEPGIFELTCTAGAQGKCIRFGYLPWESGDMLRLYNACVYMVRADYCGDGSATTRNGMLINIYDSRGIQKPDRAAGFDFEAGWTEHGAVCVRHTRVPENATLEWLARTCPRLREALGADCNEGAARRAGAFLFNRSR